MTSVYSNPNIATTLIDRCLYTRTATRIDCFISKYELLRQATKITTLNKNCITNMTTGKYVTYPLTSLWIYVELDLHKLAWICVNPNTKLISTCRYGQLSTLSLSLMKNPNLTMRKLRAYQLRVEPTCSTDRTQLLLPVNPRTITSQPNTTTPLPPIKTRDWWEQLLIPTLSSIQGQKLKPTIQPTQFPSPL